ncbi:hypothetical protein J3B02_000515 [Coemansia erecta]|nr:hypothetical protein J3B02_000515 [Coemansia erecta]
MIPPSIGSYRTAWYSMPKSQQPYKINDGSEAQERLLQIYQKDLDEAKSDISRHSMVVACSSSIGGIDHNNNNNTDILADQPAFPNEHVILYVCGGGFVMRDTPGEKWLYVRMSKELGQRVFVPRYHVAPESRFPQPIHDVYVAFRHLLSRGFKPHRITLVGASAGGNIAMAFLQILKIQQEPAIGRCVLIAPCVDLTLKSESWIRNQSRCVLRYRPLDDSLSLTRVYYGSAELDEIHKMAEHSLMSPIRGTLSGLPPVLVLVGSHDVLVDESRELVRLIENVAGSADYVEYPKKNHYTLLRGKTQLGQIYSQVRRFVVAKQ